jgi:alpha-L-fucosidase
MAIYFDALEYQGTPTRVYAWLGIPAEASAENPVPGIVLVHGGGGTAFKDWVEKWKARGYAAVAIAVEGQTDERIGTSIRPRKWKQHAWPGPSRKGIYGDSDESFTNQWMYHAVADTVLANSLMRSLPEVDAAKVGIMGVSWGGIITSTVIGIDTRFAFAIPTYGCGHLHRIDNQYARALADNELFQNVWDPALRIHRATMPALWFSWPGDQHFSLDAQAATYQAASGMRMVSLVPGMRHSNPAAWVRPESYEFADSVVRTGRPWCVQTGTRLDGNNVSVDFDCSKPLNSASLLANFGSGHTGERNWTENEVDLTSNRDGSWTASASLPPGTAGWFISVRSNGSDPDADGDGTTDRFGYNDQELTVSSDYREVGDTKVTEGSGIVGSSELLRFGAEWKTMNASAAKQRGRNRFIRNKYGMFIHWGISSTLGGVWKGEKMEEGGVGPVVSEWIMRRKSIPRAEYARVAERFNPQAFDADEWVAIARAAGMKYIVITSKHHDGFAMYDSADSDFNIVDATPFGRDVIRELETACKKADLAFGVYYSHGSDWMDGGDLGIKDYGPENPERSWVPNYYDPAPVTFDEYIGNKALPQVRELVENYSLSQLWFDGAMYMPPAHSFAFYRAVYDANPEILVNSRIGNGFGDIRTPRDNEIPDEASSNIWEGIATTNNSWGYKSYDTDWKSPLETLYWLVANVSRGGNFLLNVGPDGTGTIPPESVANLLEVGQWLTVNGEATYGTRHWKVSHEGPTNPEMRGTNHRKASGFEFDFKSNDFWFTQKDGTVYVIALARPEGHTVAVHALKGLPIAGIRVLGESGTVVWTGTDEAAVITLPELKTDGIGYALAVELDENQ